MKKNSLHFFSFGRKWQRLKIKIKSFHLPSTGNECRAIERKREEVGAVYFFVQPVPPQLLILQKEMSVFSLSPSLSKVSSSSRKQTNIVRHASISGKLTVGKEEQFPPPPHPRKKSFHHCCRRFVLQSRDIFRKDEDIKRVFLFPPSSISCPSLERERERE